MSILTEYINKIKEELLTYNIIEDVSINWLAYEIRLYPLINISSTKHRNIIQQQHISHENYFNFFICELKIERELKLDDELQIKIELITQDPHTIHDTCLRSNPIHSKYLEVDSNISDYIIQNIHHCINNNKAYIYYQLTKNYEVLPYEIYRSLDPNFTFDMDQLVKKYKHKINAKKFSII